MNLDAIAELERLADLKAKGVLTDAEFEALKARVLAGPGASAAGVASVEDETLIRRIASYEQISAIVWLLIALVQICAVVTILAGIWNVFAALSRFGMVKRIKARQASVPKAYEGVVQLVIITLINLFVGGVIGVVWVAFDVFVREQVLKNRRLFTQGAAPSASAPQPATAVPATS